MTRKICALLLACVLLLTLTACKSENKVIRAINAIGTVTMASQDKIETAEKLYAQLNAAQQTTITNLETLTKARAEFDRQNALIENAITAVAAIENSSQGLSAAVASAREAFDTAASLDVTGILSDSEAVLLAAETRLQETVQEAEKLTAELSALYETGHYAEIEPLADPYIRDIPDGQVKTQLGTFVVQALCAQAQQQFDGGSCMAAMRLLSRCAGYEACSDAGAQEQCEAQKQQYIAAMARYAPASGTVLDRTYNAGRNTFTVTVGSTDTCVKLELISDPDKYVTFYVRANDTVHVNLLNGVYRIKYTTGPIWYGEDTMFGPDATYLIAQETVEMAGYTTPTHVFWNTVTCTLHSGYDDELGMQNLNPGEF